MLLITEGFRFEHDANSIAPYAIAARADRSRLPASGY